MRVEINAAVGKRMPWSVSTSVERPNTKLSIASWPFQVSAKALKPKRVEESDMPAKRC